MAPIEYDRPGLWGPTTATIDWCEANYEISTHIAEFWNTISNFFMVVPPMIGTVLAIKDGIEKRFIWCHLALVLVGIGSTCFHGTLLYEMQLLDELPMILTAAVMIYALIEVNRAPKTQNRWLQIMLTSYCIFVSVIYLTIKNPIFHEIAYGALVIGMVFTCIRITRNFDHSSKLIMIGSAAYAIGFIIWNMDHIFCPKLRALRSQVPPMLRPILQGHAWWHVLAGVGTYLSLLFNIHARLKFLKKDPRIVMALGVWPYVRCKMSD